MGSGVKLIRSKNNSTLGKVMSLIWESKAEHYILGDYFPKGATIKVVSLKINEFEAYITFRYGVRQLTLNDKDFIKYFKEVESINEDYL